MFRKPVLLTLGMVLLLGGCGGSSSSKAPVTPPYAQNVTQTSAWIGTQQLTDGAILYTSTQIDPYFANLAAIGWLSDSTKIPQVEAWMQWYVGHLNSPDYNGLAGTIYNYDVASGVETSSGAYDSADSYAATFLSLAEALWNTNDAGAQAFIKTITENQFIVIANVITGMQQSDGLVYAKPDYQIEFLMDNSEDYRGLSDFANLATQAWADAATTTLYQASAASVQSGIQNTLFIPGNGLFYPYAGSPVPDLNTWYPDSVSQLFPIVNGVIAPSSAQAKTVYQLFNDGWPTWPQLSFNTQDPYPWCVVGYAGYLMNDKTNTENYILSIQKQYVNANPAFSWPFYSAEAGWFMRTNAGMETLP
jgi:hypothetical protein